MVMKNVKILLVLSGLLASIPAFARVEEGVPRFQVSRAYVYDAKTNLLWARCAYGQTFGDTTCLGKPAGLTMKDAQKFAQSLRKGTGKKWRLPTLTELSSLFDDSGDGVADEGLFGWMSDCECRFWTSTPVKKHAHYGVDFSADGLLSDEHPVMDDKTYGAVILVLSRP